MPPLDTDRGYHTAFKAWVIEKTFKRELAVLVLLFWFIITIRVFWFTPTSDIRALDSAYGTVTTTIWLYVVAAFGMDWASKQMGDPRARARYGDTFEGPRGGMGGRYPEERYAGAGGYTMHPPARPPMRPSARELPSGQGPGETDPSIPPKDYPTGT